MSLESVRKAGEEVVSIVAERGGLDVLVNNAGVFKFADVRTNDGYEVQMQTNHLSHFLLTKLVFKSLQDAGESRGGLNIIQLTFTALTNVPKETNMIQHLLHGSTKHLFPASTSRGR